jgi:RimJ/RimL family protein N-acetyltransferase
VDIPRTAELTDGLVVLRPLTADLVPAVTSACQDPEMHRWLSRLPFPYLEEHARSFVQESQAGWANGTGFTFAITDSSSDRFLGVCGLHEVTDLGAEVGAEAEIGYWIVAAERGRGVMTAAARLACGFAFERLGVARLEWRATVGNTGSRRVAERLGFQVEGVRRQGLVRVAARVRTDCWVGALLPGELT